MLVTKGNGISREINEEKLAYYKEKGYKPVEKSKKKAENDEKDGKAGGGEK